MPTAQLNYVDTLKLIPPQTQYQKIMLSGLAGSPLDCTWNREKHIHTCCASKVDWRHKNNCPQVIGKDEEIGNEKWKALDFMDKKAYLREIFA